MTLGRDKVIAGNLSNRQDWRRLKILVIVTLILLTVQGWFGDTVNLFTTFPSGTVEASGSGLFQAILNAGGALVIHAFIGPVLLALSIVILGSSLRSKPKNIKIPAILGLVMIVSATIGGVLFVLSGFQNNGVSAQMGGSFIGSYAFYFIELYYLK